jgi:hypothetical protein
VSCLKLQNDGHSAGACTSVQTRRSCFGIQPSLARPPHAPRAEVQDKWGDEDLSASNAPQLAEACGPRNSDKIISFLFGGSPLNAGGRLWSFFGAGREFLFRLFPKIFSRRTAEYFWV